MITIFVCCKNKNKKKNTQNHSCLKQVSNKHLSASLLQAGLNSAVWLFSPPDGVG